MASSDTKKRVIVLCAGNSAAEGTDEEKMALFRRLRDGIRDRPPWQLYRYEGGMPGFTWNLTAVRASLVPPSVWE